MTSFFHHQPGMDDEQNSNEALLAESDMMKFLVMIVLILLAISSVSDSSPEPNNTQQIEQQQKTLEKLQHLQKKQAPTPKKSIPKPSKKGYSLRFASAQSLLSLLQQQSIQVLAISKQQSYKSHWQNGKISFTINKTREHYYPLYESIPPLLVQSWYKVHADDVSWGVILPDTILSQLQKMMQNHQDGEFILHANKKLTHSP